MLACTLGSDGRRTRGSAGRRRPWPRRSPAAHHPAIVLPRVRASILRMPAKPSLCSSVSPARRSRRPWCLARHRAFSVAARTRPWARPQLDLHRPSRRSSGRQAGLPLRAPFGHDRSIKQANEVACKDKVIITCAVTGAIHTPVHVAPPAGDAGRDRRGRHRRGRSRRGHRASACPRPRDRQARPDAGGLCAASCRASSSAPTR